MSARSFVGETSISAWRSSARVRAGPWPDGADGKRRPPIVRSRGSLGSRIDVLHQFVHEGGYEADGSDRLRVGHPGGAEDADDADRPAGLPVRGEDERDVAHLLGRVLRADEDLDPI